MTSLKTVIAFCLVFGLAVAEQRLKRQAYDGNYGGNAGYRQPQQGYPQQGYQQQAYGHQPAQQQQYAPQQAAQRPPRQHGHASSEEEEKEQGPHPLTLLLENSKFECGAKSDGYYADSGVGCQAFHYCVSGQKHSMMCPAGTVFHQVHLNCVPQDQDICNKADKFFFVNDYLNRAVEKGPNNTVVYAQRYYPENYAVGDPFIPPQEAKKEAPAATYGLGPAYRVQQPAPQDYRQQQPAHVQQTPAHQPAAYAAPHHAQQPQVHRPQPAPYTPPAPQVYQQRPAHHPAPQPAHQPQVQLYGYGAQQQYNAQAQSAQRAYNQHQQQALGPQQNVYGAGHRPGYAQQY